MATIIEIIRGVTGGLAAPVVDYMKARQELRSKERLQKMEYAEAVHQRKIELVKQGLTADINWEMEFARQAETSWKDEYTLGVVSIPAILAFFKTSWLDGPRIVSEGFAALGQTPFWYQTVLVSMFMATVGIRWYRRTISDT